MVPNDPILDELIQLDAQLPAQLESQDSAARVTADLAARFTPSAIAVEGPSQRLWEVVGLTYLSRGRVHDALAVFTGLYEHMLLAQASGSWAHKGMPLCWISDCFTALGFRAHAKRYLMLTLCEDALRQNGKITPNTGGVYFRLVWRFGLSDREFHRYAAEMRERRDAAPETKLFPEAILQRIDTAWSTELPALEEAFVYRINAKYVRRLIARLGEGDGEELELLADYLLSCMPGCRTKRRQRSGSTDYDVVCSLEGVGFDFRSELGRYFVCECKDWQRPADFTTMAKFCRVLDSVKAKFGILFARSGASGDRRALFAELEQLKVFQDRGIVIVVVDKNDLEQIAAGANFISLLRERYEAVRLDIRG